VASPHPLRVLVVDESDAFRESVEEWIAGRADLRLAGTARGGLEALDAIDRARPDLVILDAILADIDGFRITPIIKKSPSAPLVVLVTFHASAAARERALAVGADGFLAKQHFTDGIEALLAGWEDAGRARDGAVRTPARRGRPESQTVPDP
jgi:CheY-like chemotaxis protein